LNRGTIVVKGASVAWRAWGPPSSPGVVFLHGGRANQRWWDAVLPGLTRTRRLVTFDLSGHGISGHRARYDVVSWSGDLAAVIATATQGRATVIAHSMGGRVALAAVPTLGERLERLILVDVPIKLAPEPELYRKLRQPRKVYTSRTEAVRHFRVVPGSPMRLDIARDVAAASLERADGGGWAYRGDPSVVGRIPNGVVLDGLAQLRAPVGVIRGADSPFVDELCLALMPGGPDGPAPVTVVPGAGHHGMLDAPEALADAIEAMLENLSSA
jgi:pimeloyl-ACP methyl ester carboxylesterase